MASADPVAAELRRWASEPFDWRDANCGLSVLDYVERQVDLRLAARPRFDSKAAALRHVLAAGGMLSLCGEAMARLCCPPTELPERGDVGVVALAGGETAAICVARIDLRIEGQAAASTAIGRRWVWAARGDRAVVIERAEPVASWRVRCLKR
ncbi:DUF6950 family protein [Sphingomonas koreensis]